MRRLQSIFGWLLVSALLGACASNDAGSTAILQDPWGTVRIRADQAVRIGAVSPSSSDLLSSEAQEIVRGTTLAVERRGFVQGFAIEIVEFDSGCNTALAAEAADAIVADSSLVGAVGFFCSEACQIAGPLLDEGHSSFISPGCGANILTDEVSHSGSFLRTMYSDSREGIAAAQFAYNELGARRGYLVGDGSLSSSAAIRAFEAEFMDLGGIIVRETLVGGDQILFDDVILEVQTTRPDVIYGPLLTQTSAEFVGNLNAASLSQIPFIGGRLAWTSSFIEMTGAVESSNVYSIGPPPTSESFTELIETYQQRFSSMPTSITFAYAYDAASLLLRGIETASTIDRQDLVVGRLALRNALYETAGYPAITGLLTCTEWGDCSAGDIAVAHIHNNQWQVVYVP